ncbi:MAG: AAA family ATPase, partial [Archaeoglobaceae archaeon]
MERIEMSKKAKIKRIEVQNFKSFNDLKVELGDFNVVIGPNASGKSNFVQIFKFLKDMATSGLDNAISMQGGGEYLTNMKIRSSKEFSIKIVASGLLLRESIGDNIITGIIGIVIEEAIENVSEKRSSFRMMTLQNLTYELTLKFKGRRGFEILAENLTCGINFKRDKKIEKGELILNRIGKKGEVRFHLPPERDIEIPKDDTLYILSFGSGNKLSPTVSFFDMPTPILTPLKEICQSIAIYDFDPKLSKKATPITGKIELEEDGRNLPLVLKNILERKEEKRKLSNLIQYLLPFVEDLSVEKFADKSMLFKMRESYFTDQYLPASLISDGTINITAMIVALFFEKKNLAIIEEPERNVHPQLISRVVNMMKDASKKKQIIVTTHNPEFVKHAGLENLLLISRDDDGFSRITRPKEKEEVKTFLENKLGIEELY